jgi:hypothetical protein
MPPPFLSAYNAYTGSLGIPKGAYLSDRGLGFPLDMKRVGLSNKPDSLKNSSTRVTDLRQSRRLENMNRSKRILKP